MQLLSHVKLQCGLALTLLDLLDEIAWTIPGLHHAHLGSHISLGIDHFLGASRLLQCLRLALRLLVVIVLLAVLDLGDQLCGTPTLKYLARLLILL